jgi:replication initiation and membrane attachment protein DnaB
MRTAKAIAESKNVMEAIESVKERGKVKRAKKKRNKVGERKNLPEWREEADERLLRGSI